jgi:phosphoribosylamine--glycine ligase
LKILVIGSGGREHAIVWRLAQSAGVEEVIACPGNPGIAKLGRCLPAPASVQGYADLATAERIDLTVVGPEATLVAGIADEFDRRGMKIVGPTKAAAQLEGSKIFAKQFFVRAGIPTARSVEVISEADALCVIKQFSFPVVIKADGLAAGKGVVIAQTQEEACEAIRTLGPRLVIEEFLRGEEVSFIGISNGQTLIPLEASQDHKRIGDNDTGPNTGGMGAYSDGRILDASQAEVIMGQVMNPAIAQMAREGTPFRGFLYAGLILAEDGPKVLEFNVRLGDPETQALLHRLKGGFLEALLFAAGGPVPRLVWNTDPSVCVVLAAEGYPEHPRVGDAITGIAEAEATGAVVFHAGTKNAADQIVSSGGRVLGVTAAGPTLESAIDRAYTAADLIHFKGKQLRRDIGKKGLSRWQAGR